MRARRSMWLIGAALVLAACDSSAPVEAPEVAEAVAPDGQRAPAAERRAADSRAPQQTAPSPARPPTPPTTEPRQASLSIPGIGVRDLAVVPYRGRPDDGQGTRIQNDGVAASPYGPRGGEGPGAIGNYIVTAHRTSSTRAFEFRAEAEPTKAYITLSTCATPEDHAAGNWWSDRFGNLEHRIDKIGVLVRTVELA